MENEKLRIENHSIRILHPLRPDLQGIRFEYHFEFFIPVF